MKKQLFFLVISLLVVANASALVPFRTGFSVRNETKYPIMVGVKYSQIGICSDDYFIVRPGETRKQLSEKDCCSKSIRAQKIIKYSVNEPAKVGKWHEFFPKYTGFGQSCRYNLVVIKENEDGSLTMERLN